VIDPSLVSATRRSSTSPSRPTWG